jgi:hypothetical protein
MTKEEFERQMADAQMRSHYMNMQQHQQNAYQGSSNLNQQQMAGTFGGTAAALNPQATTDWERSRIILGFKKNHPELAEFVEATAKLMGYDVEVALSPFDVVMFSGRNAKPHFIWRVRSRRWSMDVQWMHDEKGGGEAVWIERFAALTDGITAEKAECEKSGTPFPPEPPVQEHPTITATQIQNAYAAVARGMQGYAGPGNTLGAIAQGGVAMGVVIGTTTAQVSAPPKSFWKGLLSQ